MSRETCWRCFWPREHCFCGTIRPMDSRTRFLILMHPMEFKREKANTGRLAGLCLANSRIIMGLDFADNAELAAELADPERQAMLLWPGAGATRLAVAPERAPGSPAAVAPDWFRQGAQPSLATGAAGGEGRPLTLILLDATWACGRQMFRRNPRLQALPRLELLPASASRYVIKEQPRPGCLSTLETCHELLLALEQAGIDRYADKEQLLRVFDRMQAFQIACQLNPPRPSYRTGRAPSAASPGQAGAGQTQVSSCLL